MAWGGTHRARVEGRPRGATLESADDWVAAQQAEISRGVDVLAIMALVFVFIALFVGVMVIANTFAILFAQRMRDFALLRCVGVTRRQLRRAVRLEALALGLAASALGVAVGTALGYGLVALVRHWYADMGSAALGPAVDGRRLRHRPGRHPPRRLAPDPERDQGASAGGAATRHRRRRTLRGRSLAAGVRRRSSWPGAPRCSPSPWSRTPSR